MFDIGGWEFLIIIVIAIIVIGPKDLPGTIRTITGWIRKARGLARDFQSGLDDLARETEIDSVRNEIQSGLGIDEVTGAGNSIRQDIEQAVDPDGQLKDTFNENDPFADSDFGGEEDLGEYGEIAEDEGTEEKRPTQPVVAADSNASTETVERSPANTAEKT